MPLVKSSHLRSVKRNKKTGELEIRFKNQSRYVYEDVTKQEEKNLLKASSKGRQFWRTIRGIKPYRET